MKEVLIRFLREEEGQDLIEYTLLLAGIWTVANSFISNANAAATS